MFVVSITSCLDLLVFLLSTTQQNVFQLISIFLATETQQFSPFFLHQHLLEHMSVVGQHRRRRRRRRRRRFHRRRRRWSYKGF